MIQLRTYVFVDSLQPQLAEYLGTVSQGFLPVPGDACLWLEVSPGMAIHRLTDVALKAAQVHLVQQVVERAFGAMLIHHRTQSDVLEAGHSVLSRLRTTEDQRHKCRIAWAEVIRAISPEHAVVINRQDRRGSMILPGQSMFIIETEPAGYVVYAANEAEKAAKITLIDVKAVGAFGRLTLAGKEADIDEAASAAVRALNGLSGIAADGRGRVNHKGREKEGSRDQPPVSG